MQPPPSSPDPKKRPPAPPRVPELVGATSEPFYLGPQPTQIILAMHAPTGPASSHEGLARREVWLDVENVTSNEPSPPFRVYLNVPPGVEPEQHPELRVGNMGMFGLVQQSDPHGRHGGNGMTFNMDITEAFTRLAAVKNWDARNLRVSFSPGFWEGPPPHVKVGRVSLYFK